MAEQTSTASRKRVSDCDVRENLKWDTCRENQARTLKQEETLQRSKRLLPAHVMLLAKISLPAYPSSAVVQAKKELLDFDLNDRSASYWPQPNMSEARSPLQANAMASEALMSEQSLYLPPPGSNPDLRDDNGDPSMSEERDKGGRPKRKRIAPHQLEVLLHLFQQTDTPSYEQREKVAGHLGMSNREVQVR